MRWLAALVLDAEVQYNESNCIHSSLARVSVDCRWRLWDTPDNVRSSAALPQDLRLWSVRMYRTITVRWNLYLLAEAISKQSGRLTGRDYSRSASLKNFLKTHAFLDPSHLGAWCILWSAPNIVDYLPADTLNAKHFFFSVIGISKRLGRYRMPICSHGRRRCHTYRCSRPIWNV